MAGLKEYVSQSYKELKYHVTWPTYVEAQKLTIIVLVFSIIFALAIWGIDTVFNSIVDLYFKWVNS